MNFLFFACQLLTILRYTFYYFINELALELISTGIFTSAVKVGPGVWEGDIDLSRIFNHDETPQFINYGVDGTPNGLVYA